ncbi:MAG: serine/threonine-protein kinase [Byssovorax sp.]
MSSIKVGRVIAGKYQLERPLAKGGMGSIWVARHLQLETTVAIKFIEPGPGDITEARGRFAREAKAAAQLQGPHLVQIHDYGVEDDNPYMVMERLEGEDLSTRLKRETRLSLPAVDEIIRQVARVLRRAQEAGIVHRDLKPGNIFLVRGGDDDEIVKVLDFGVAKIRSSLSSEEMTKSGTLLGSPRYMSPEQARGVKSIDHRSDLWSLAVIAFRAVTGELPFQGNEIGDVIIKICTERVPAPSALVPGLSPAIDRFFVRAFERDPDKRFQSAGQLARAFTAAVGHSAMADPETDDSSNPSTTRNEKGPRTPNPDEIRTGARLSWFRTRSESPGDIDRSHRIYRRRATTAAALALLASSVGLILHAMFAKGPSHPPAGTPAAAILGDSAAQSFSSPVVIVGVPLPASVAPVLPPPSVPSVSPDPPVPSVRPASVEPAGTASAAAPPSTPRRPVVNRKNSILGI